MHQLREYIGLYYYLNLILQWLCLS